MHPRELATLYRHNLLSRRDFVRALIALGVSGAALEAALNAAPVAQAASTPPGVPHLCLIVLDGFRPDYAALAPMPALGALIQEGTSYDHAWVGQLESLTPVSHASLSTGSFPKHHGIVGFQWRDPATGKEVLDGWDQDPLASPILHDLHVGNLISLPLAIKKADPTAKVVSISSEKVYAADAMGGPGADYILHYRENSSGVLEPTAVPGHLPPDGFLERYGPSYNTPLRHFSDWDYLSTRLAVGAIHEFRPRALLLNLPGADVYGHLFGGPATPDVMRRIVKGIDRNIARVVEAYKAEGLYDQTLFVVTADHGMTPNMHVVLPAGVKEAGRRAGAGEMFHTGGTASYIYLDDSRSAAAVAKEVARLPRIAASYYRTMQNGVSTYLPASGTAVHPELDAAFRYLLTSMDGPESPDVVAPFAENTIGKLVTHAYGHHGGLNWGAQHVPLVLAGPGVRRVATSHFPARLVDMAATMARVLGVSLSQQDGIVLADALITPRHDEVERQAALSSFLAIQQNAIIAQYVSDTLADQQAGIVPLPSLPARPY